MNLKEISLEIAEAFIARRYPDHLEEFERYRIIRQLDEGSQPVNSKLLGPTEIAEVILSPIVVYVVSRLIYDLLKPRLSLKKLSTRDEIDVEKLALCFKSRNKRRRILKLKTSTGNLTKRHELVREVIEFTEEYVEIKIETDKA
jgi:hypothetical protein